MGISDLNFEIYREYAFDTFMSIVKYINHVVVTLCTTRYCGINSYQHIIEMISRRTAGGDLWPSVAAILAIRG